VKSVYRSLALNFEKIALSYNKVPESEIDSRISRFQRLLRREDIYAAVILQLIDRFYFSGTIQDGILIIPAEGDPRYLCRRSVERARAETTLDVVPFRSLKEIPVVLGRRNTRLGLELDVVPAGLFTRISALVPGTDWQDLGPLVRGVRAVKSGYETDRITSPDLPETGTLGDGRVETHSP